jgi:maleylacetoacetate isomerase
MQGGHRGRRATEGAHGVELYTYYRSGAAYRTRIALALKGVAYDSIPIDLAGDPGAQNDPAYRAINPQARLPALRLDDGDILIQSPAIIEYLEETVPEPPFLPKDAVLRAKIRGVAAIIGCDAHPLNNSSVLKTLRTAFAADSAQIHAWVAQWLTLSFMAVEALIGDEGFCFGPSPGLADIYLIPQIASAQRFDVPIAGWPRIVRVAGLAASHPAFMAAAPARQPDAK